MSILVLKSPNPSSVNDHEPMKLEFMRKMGEKTKEKKRRNTSSPIYKGTNERTNERAAEKNIFDKKW